MLQDVGIASGGGPLGQLRMALHASPLAYPHPQPYASADPSHPHEHHSPTGPPPDPDTVEAAKPREHRDWRKLLGEDNKQGYGQGQGQQQGHKRQR